MQYVTFIGSRGTKRKPNERTYNPGNERNYGSVVKSLTTYPFGRRVYELFGVSLVPALPPLPRLFSLDSFSLFLLLSLSFYLSLFFLPVRTRWRKEAARSSFSPSRLITRPRNLAHHIARIAFCRPAVLIGNYTTKLRGAR